MKYIAINEHQVYTALSLWRSDYIFINPSFPEYILDFFKSIGVRAENKSMEEAKEIEITPIHRIKKYSNRTLTDNWVSEEELNKIEYPLNTYIVDNITENAYKSRVGRFYVLKGVGKSFDGCIEVDNAEQIPQWARYFSFLESKAKDKIVRDAEIYVYINQYHEEYNYRRNNLFKFLQKQGKDVALITSDMLNKFTIDKITGKTLIITNPLNAEMLLSSEPKKMIFEFSDNWFFYYSEDVINAYLNKADFITYVSENMKELFSEEVLAKAKYIHNGVNTTAYYALTKNKVKTAVYCGRNASKVDWEVLDNLAKENKDWEFWVYTQEIPETKQKNIVHKGLVSEVELNRILKKAHLGLIVSKENDWSKYQNNIKYFTYSNNHIQTLAIGSHSMDSFPNVIKDIKEYKPCNDWAFIESYDWKKIFTQWCEFTGV